MTLHNYIIHELVKERGGSPVLNQSSSLPPVNDLAYNLLSRLLDRYKQQVAWGRFKESNASGFKTEFDTYCDSNRGDEEFIAFTTTASEILSSQIQNIGPAVGGYLLFVDYTNQHDRFVSVYLIRDIDGFQFDREQERFDVRSVPHLGIDRLAMACRINVSSYENRSTHSSNYLSFMRGRQTDSNYFYNWIEAEELHQSALSTQALVEIFKEIELPPQVLGDVSPSRDRVREAVQAYCNALPNRQLDLSELSLHLYGEGQENKIVDYAESKQIQIATVFTPDRSKMRRMVKVIVEADNISLKFPIVALTEQTITVSANGAVVINSPSLASQVRAEISQEEEQQNQDEQQNNGE